MTMKHLKQTGLPAVNCKARVLTCASMLAVLATAEIQGRSGVKKAEDAKERWVATWSTALHAPDTVVFGTNPGFENQTLRQVVHTSVGGDRVRVRLSTFGAGALTIGAARIARRDSGAAIDPGSDRELTFGGAPSVRIPPGATVLSDPVELEAPALSDLAVSIFVPEKTGPATWHYEALQTSYLSPPGDFTASLNMPFVSTTRYRDPMGVEREAWYWLAGVEVMASRQTGAIVAFGDSITDGTRSAVDANNRWPDYLARRLMAESGISKLGVLNLGIAGNKLLNEVIGPNALARSGRDVLEQTGVSHVIVQLGNNDLLFVFSPADAVTVEQIIGGHRQLIRRAHARDLKIYGSTLTPFGNFALASAAKENMRQQINKWIRESGEYDAVIDFDAVTRNPDLPSQLKPEFDSGDHLHPNEAGYQAMAEAIDLKLFKNQNAR
jgi:lysophospholipase L1-like esterase